MKILIEVSGGSVQNIVATQECSIILIDHDNIKERDEGGGENCLKDAVLPFQPFRVTNEEGEKVTPMFDECLFETIKDYLEECGQCGGYHPIGYTGDCRDDRYRF